MTKTSEVGKIYFRNMYWEVNCNEDVTEILPNVMLCWLYSIIAVRLLTTLLHTERSSIAYCFAVIGSLKTGSAVCIILTPMPELSCYFQAHTTCIIACTISKTFIFVN
jgi:uncharacterized protein YybS (DUF2232 family)